MQALESLTETQVSTYHPPPNPGGCRQWPRLGITQRNSRDTLREPPVVCASLVACGGGDESPALVPAWPGHPASSSSEPPPAPDHLTLRSFLSHGDCHGVGGRADLLTSPDCG